MFTRMLLDEIYYLIELPFDWLSDDAIIVYLPDELVLVSCYIDLIWETDVFELASLIILVLQGNQLTKHASHPIWRQNQHKFSWCGIPKECSQNICLSALLTDSVKIGKTYYQLLLEECKYIAKEEKSKYMVKEE